MKILLSLLLLSGFFSPDKVSAQDSPDELTMSKTFDAWDRVLSFCRITDGALYCGVFDLKTREAVDRAVVGENDVRPGMLQTLEVMVKVTFDSAMKNHYFENLDPENAANFEPQFACVLRQYSDKRGIGGPALGFKSKTTAIAFAKTFKRAAENVRQMKKDPPK